jgi:hypothetical protein
MQHILSVPKTERVTMKNGKLKTLKCTTGLSRATAQSRSR